MTRKEAAAKCLKLRDTIQDLLEPPNMQDSESRRVYGQNLRDFGDIYQELTKKVFDFARIVRDE